MIEREPGRFRLLLGAAGISNLGDGIAQAAMPLLVASITRDPVLVAGAFIASQAPWLLFALVSGAFVDRLDRRLTMVIVDSIRAAVIAVLGIAALTGRAEIWLIYLIGFLLTSAETLFDPASEAILPQLVGRERLAHANSRLQSVTWVANSFVGPPLGAAMFSVMAGLPFVVDALSFVVAAVLVARIPGQYRAERPEGGKSGLRNEVTDGLRFIANHRVLRWTTPMAGLTNFASFAIIAIFVLYAQDVLGLDAFGYGLLLSSLGIGGLVGAVAAGSIVGRLGAAGAIRITLVIGVLSTLTFVLITNPIAAGIAVAAFGFQITLWNVTVVSLRQELVPDRLRGRVAGASRLVTWGVQPLGALAGGVLASALGLRAPFVFAVAVLMIAAVIAWFALTPQSIETARREAARREAASSAG